MIIRLDKRTHSVFYCLITLLIALVFARYVFQLDIPRIVLSALIIVIALQGDRDEILAVSMCCIPLHNAVSFYIAVAACAIIYVLKNPNRIRVGLTVVLVLIMVIWELLHCFVFDVSLVSFLATIAPLIFLMMILSADIQDIDYAFIVRTMAVVSVFTCVLCLAIYFVRADYNIVYTITNLRRLGMISGDDVLLGSEINPNSLGIVNILGISGLLQLRSVKQHKKIDLFFVSLLLIFGLLTSSRTFLVCLILMIVLLIMGQRGNIKKGFSFFVLIILLSVLALLAINWLFPEILEYYANRFLSTTDITGGRSDLISAYHDYISNNIDVMFFGVGASDLEVKATSMFHFANNLPHNSIQEIIVVWGIPGFIMIVLLLIMMINEAKKYNVRKSILNYIPLFIILAKSLAGQLLTSGYTMLALAFAYLSLCQDFNPKNDNQLSTTV